MILISTQEDDHMSVKVMKWIDYYKLKYQALNYRNKIELNKIELTNTKENINWSVNNEVELNTLNKILGTSGGIVETPGGQFQSMCYDSDFFYDDDRDGLWGRGESVELVNCTSQVNHG